MERNSPKIAVLGAGVVGMTVAKILQDNLHNAPITLIADKFKEETVSSVAAGIFRPGTSFRGPTKEITRKWVHDSWQYWQDILKTTEAPQAGVTELSSYIFSNQNYEITRNYLIEDIVPIYRPVTGDELKICGVDFKYGSFFSTMTIGCTKHLPWLERMFINRGGVVVKNKIENFSQLREFELVFNCTGLGAKQLCIDHDLVPIRGQVLKVRAPWLKTAFYGDYDTYIIPGIDGVASLGGVRQYDSYNLDVCKYDSAAIYERCCKLMPSLTKTEIVGTKVGLRPHRVPVRVEPELVDGLRVIHCYGHGGYGVTCAPGTALNAVDIGLDLLRSNLKNKL